MSKKIFLSLSAALLIGVFFIGCRKNNVDSQLVQEQNTNANTIKSARDYFENNVQNQHKSMESNMRQSVSKIPLWERAYEIKLADGQFGVIVPLRFEKQLSLNAESAKNSLKLANTSHLLIRMGESKSAQLVTTIPGSFIKNNKLNLSEITFVEDWNGNVIAKTAIKDGRTYRFNTAQAEKKLNSIRLNANQCLYIVWSLCDVIDGQLTNCEYVGTESIGCNEGLQPVDDSGGCEIVDPAAGAHAVGDDLGGSATTVDQFQKDRVMTWKCVNADTWYIQSSEAGRVKLVDVAQDIWNWVTFTHTSVAFNGYARGGTITLGNVVAAPNFTPGTQNVSVALMYLYVPVTYTTYAYQCAMASGGSMGALASVLAPPKTITYEPYKGWNAKP